MTQATGSSDFYLGRKVDPSQAKPQPQVDQPVLYDPADLTTHAFVTGMTGSGKTGLCVTLLEEAALQGIPALMIDPKGDLTNLLLHFPNLAPSDFEPWIEPDAARREGKTTAEMAEQTAALWRNGLAEWGIQPERIAALQKSVHFAVFTPGSDAGTPISIMTSLQAPSIPWEGNREIIRERISSTVTALLGLVGLSDIDPVRSREHILLSNIFENAWSKGDDLDLTELILQTQNPPFAKLGVFPVDTFIPQKERFDLSMLLNNFLAAPAFQVWMEGQPLDVPSLLYGPDGRPRHSIFYLAHLGDTERMFFVTLLFSAVETWMRTQSGTSSLRSLLYFDEIVGYLPPIANPPSKPILMRMLKQARAFGVGLLLASQNPVDIDYKALSNAGTWFIGKLQTDQDKQRLLDGLESAAGGLDRGVYDRLISGLGKRVFLLHNVHDSKPIVFQTRWAMNYLAGPLTRAQIPNLIRLTQSAGAQPVSVNPMAASVAGFASPAPAVTSTPPPRTSSQEPAPLPTAGSFTRPAVPASVAEYFFPNNLTQSESLQAENISLPTSAKNAGLLYRPALLAQAEVRYLARKYNLDTIQRKTALVENPDRRGMLRWDDQEFSALDPKNLESNPMPQVRFAALEAPLSEARLMASMQKDFLDWVYRSSTVQIRANEALKVYAGPEASTAQFREQCSQAARKAAEAELAKIGASFDSKIAALQTKLKREQLELDQDQDQHNQRKMEELGTHAENIFGLFTGKKRRVSSSLTKRRLTQNAKASVEESRQMITALQAQIAEMQADKTQALQEVNDRWAHAALESQESTITPLKKDIYLEVFGVAWLPYYLIQDGDKVVELPGFGV